MDDLRKFALDMAATSMRGAPFTEIVLAAQAFHAFLEPRNEIPESAKTILGGASPPPIPELVQQVRHDADLSQADQSPGFMVVSTEPQNPNIYGYVDDPRVMRPKTTGHASDCALHNMPAYPAGPCDCADDDTKTRIISRT